MRLSWAKAIHTWSFLFTVLGSSVLGQEKCLSGLCDDRPSCPLIACSCVFPSGIDCSIYYLCHRGKPHQLRCSAGLLFNAETLTCDHAENVKCNNSALLSTDVTESDAAEVRTTAFFTNGTAVSISTPEATSRVIEISQDLTSDEGSNQTVGTSTILVTTTGTSATPEQPSSDTSSRSSTPHQDSSPNETTLANVSDSSSVPDDSFTTVITADATIGDSEANLPGGASQLPGGTGSFSCPNDGLFSDPMDCTRFYQCSNGLPHLHNCPTNLHFNPLSLECDWSYEADCNSTSFPTNSSVDYETSPGEATNQSTKESLTSSAVVSFSTTLRTETSYSEDEHGSTPGTTNASTSTSVGENYSFAVTKIRNSTTVYEMSDITTAYPKIGEDTTNAQTFVTEISVAEHLTSLIVSSETSINAVSTSSDANNADSLLTDESTASSNSVAIHTTQADTTTKARSPGMSSSEPEMKSSSTLSDLDLTTVRTQPIETTSSTIIRNNKTNSVLTPELETLSDEKTSLSPTIEETTYHNGGEMSGVSTKVAAHSTNTTVDSEVKRSSRISETSTTFSTTNISTFTTKLSNTTDRFIYTTDSDTLNTKQNNQSGSFSCPTYYGLYADEEDCRRFYHCSHYIPYHKLCPSYLHFNPALHVCDWPYRAGCDFHNRSSSFPSISSSTVSMGTTTIKDNKYTCGCDSCILPVPDDCSRYIICIDMEPLEVVCQEGLMFNINTSTCDIAENVDCSHDIECPVPDGRFAYFGTCSYYLECHDNVATVHQCPENLNYDDRKKTCGWDGTCNGTTSTDILLPVENLCNCTYCLRSVEGSCTKFVICDGSSAFEAECDTGLVFNSNLQVCDYDYNVQCPTTENILVCASLNGYFPHPDNCSLYIHCVNGDPTVKSCSSGLHFNPRSQSCDWPSSAVCGTLTTPLSDIIDDIPVPCECDCCMKSDDRNCSVFTVCINYVGKRRSCANGLYFNEVTKNCDFAENVDCIKCPKPHGFFPYPKDCSKYVHCDRDVAEVKSCPSNLHFNPASKVCDWPTSNSCYDEIDESFEHHIVLGNCTCECCVTEHDTDCNKYYLCVQKTLYEGTCSEGLLFNPHIMNCDISSSVHCPQPHICTNPNGAVPFDRDCTSYYECIDGIPHRASCPPGLHFSQRLETCDEPCLAKCDSNLDCTVSSESSDIDVLPVASKECLAPDGLFPSKKNCSEFYSCSNGQAYLMVCPEGLNFNSESHSCDHPCNAKCDTTIDCSTGSEETSNVVSNTEPTVTTPEKSTYCPELNGLFPDHNNCSQFYSCSNGRPYTVSCPPGLHFDLYYKLCNHPCEAKCDTTIDCIELTTEGRDSHCLSPDDDYPNPNDCNSYYRCHNWLSELVNCKSGWHYSVDDKKCEPPCVAGCDLNLDCPEEEPHTYGYCTCDGCYYPDEIDCSAYYNCKHHQLTKEYCDYGTLYNRNSRKCEDDKNVSCDPLGDPDMCLGDQGSFPYPGDCQSFVYCKNGVAHVISCPSGQEFQSDIRTCGPPSGSCNTTKSQSCGNHTGLYPHPTNCSMFYQCDHGTALLKECPHGLFFNNILKVCDWLYHVTCQEYSTESTTKTQWSEPALPITELTTKSVLSTGSPDPNGDLLNETCDEVTGVVCPCACRVPSYEECSIFYQCQDDGTACKKRCPHGLYFNKREMVCDFPQNVECRDFYYTYQRRLLEKSDGI